MRVRVHVGGSSARWCIMSWGSNVPTVSRVHVVCFVGACPPLLLSCACRREAARRGAPAALLNGIPSQRSRRWARLRKLLSSAIAIP